MMWGDVRCGEFFSKNCEVQWGAETLFFEKCSSLDSYAIFKDGHTCKKWSLYKMLLAFLSGVDFNILLKTLSSILFLFRAYFYVGSTNLSLYTI